MKRKSRPKMLSIGSISSGTMRSEDLIPAFIDALEPLHLQREDRKKLNALKRELDLKFAPSEEEAGYILEDLTSLLDSYTPPYCYFGATEGDGADYGVWPAWSAIEDAVRDKDMGRGDSLPTSLLDQDQDMFLLVNDHGNATLYKMMGVGWREVWSVV